MNLEKLNRIRILFICLGNICRSPAAHAVMQQKVEEAGLSHLFMIDSAGIGPWHVGQLPDNRMRKHGAHRGYQVDHIARQFNPAFDFDAFDYIVVMDEENYSNLTRRARNAAEKAKVVKMADYFTKHKNATSVPDPYYGGEEGFDLALDLIEDGCEGLIKTIAAPTL